MLLCSHIGGSRVSDHIHELGRSQLCVDAEQVAMALQESGVGFWEYDIAGDCFLWSPQVYSFLGLDQSDEDIPFSIMLKMVHQDDAQRFCQHIQMMRRVPVEAVYRMVRPDGKHRDVLFKSQPPLWHTHGRISGVVRDMTQDNDTKALIEALQRETKQATTMAGLGYWEWDLERDRLHWSDGMLGIWGLLREDFQPYYDFMESLILSEDRIVLQEALANSRHSKGLDVQVRIVRPDGEMRWVRLLGDWRFDKEGNLTRVTGASQDVSEYKRAQEALQLSRHRQDWAQKFAHLGYWEYSITHGKLTWSAETYRIFGFEEGTTVALSDILAIAHPDDVPLVTQAFCKDSVFEAFHIEFRIIRFDGEESVVGLQSEGVFGEGPSDEVFGFCRDVTDQRRAERIVKESEELLRKAEKLSVVGQLAAGVAHEIRNPLTALKGFTQLFYRNSDSDSRQYYDIMLSELNRIETILGELLVLAKPQSGRYKPQDVSVILHEVISLLATQAIMQSVNIQTEFRDDAILVSCDRNQIKQVFVNIIKNAIEAMPDGGDVLVRLFRDGEVVVIEFQDQGAGIPADQLQKLGEPFYTTKDKGTGLGLMVSHKILTDHGGSLKLESEPGSGTCVRIVLPEFFDVLSYNGLLQP